MGETLLSHVVAIIKGRPSLGLVIVAVLALSGVVLLMALYLLVLRAWLRIRGTYRRGRAALYEPAIELLLMERPYEEVREALRPRRRGDGDMVQEVIVDSLRHLQGAPFETLRRAALELGFVEDNLRALRGSNPHARGHAMERLGLLKAPLGGEAILSRLDSETTEFQLVGLRALAAIGDPSVLPRFLVVADALPPPLLPRLASLMLEFGAPGRDAVRELMNRRAKDFPAASVRDLLQELAQDWGAA